MAVVGPPRHRRDLQWFQSRPGDGPRIRPPLTTPVAMEPLSPQVMHKLVFTILVHGLPDAQTEIALDVLSDAQNSPHAQVRELAVVALAELPVPPAKRVAVIGRALKDASARVRRRAARALGDFGQHALSALPLLMAGLKDSDTSVRRDCAGAIGRFGPAAHAAAKGLVELLAEADTRVRIVSSTALKRLGRVAVPALLDGLHSPNAEVRGRCATVLGHIAPDEPTVTDALRTTLYDADEEVRHRAGQALELMIAPMAVLIPA